MPHLIIEYSDNLASPFNTSRAIEHAHQVMIDSGLFNSSDIKTRAYQATDFLVGTKGKTGSFAHLTVYLMEGRPVEIKQKLAKALFTKLDELITIDQLSENFQKKFIRSVLYNTSFRTKPLFQ